MKTFCFYVVFVLFVLKTFFGGGRLRVFFRRIKKKNKLAYLIFFSTWYIVQYFDRTVTGERLVPSMVCVLVLIPTGTGTMNGAVSKVLRVLRRYLRGWMSFIHYFCDLTKRFL